MTDPVEHRMNELERRTATLEQRVLTALLELAKAVSSVEVVAGRLASFELRFAAHDEEENEDRKRLTSVLDKLSQSVQPLIDERRAITVLTNGLVRASVILGAAITIAGFGPRILSWFQPLLP